jgi:type III restriction enzyme
MPNAVSPSATRTREQTVIHDPKLNSPFEEPQAHFRFDENGITDQVVYERRLSSYFVPIPQAHKRSKQQLQLDSEWAADRKWR